MNKPRIYVNLKADMTEGARYVDFTAMFEALESGQPVSEVDLAKLEHTAMSGSMPPAKFSHMPNHWGTSLDNDEKAEILSWAANERKACFTSPTVADEFANEPLQPLMELIPVDSAKVALGFALYHDTRLSADNTVSCATCHVGMNIGGQSYDYMGIKNSYFDYRGTGLTDGDNGRYAETKQESDLHKFKTPTLRNVMITYPYMHDGSINNIEDAVRIMHEFQIGTTISDTDMAKIVAFLGSLTGEYNVILVSTLQVIAVYLKG